MPDTRRLKAARQRVSETLARIPYFTWRALAGPRLVILAILAGAWVILVGGIFLWAALRAI